MDILVWHLPKDKVQLPTDVSFPNRCQYCIALVQSQKTVLQDTVHVSLSTSLAHNALLWLPAFSLCLLAHP